MLLQLKSKINKILVSAIFLFSAFLFHGCTAPGILATGAGSTMVIAEGDKTLGDTIDDATIKLNISAKFLSSNKILFLNIDIKVTEGRVLLTGIVQEQETRIEAVRRVWEVSGVKEVINEIEVGDKKTLKEYANDVWITAQVKSVAAKNLGLRALGYNFETIRGKVFIAGITSRKDQLDLLIQSIETVKGVKDIVNYVVVKE